jgi:hypothetical protein
MHLAVFRYCSATGQGLCEGAFDIVVQHCCLVRHMLYPSPITGTPLSSLSETARTLVCVLCCKVCTLHKKDCARDSMQTGLRTVL